MLRSGVTGHRIPSKNQKIEETMQYSGQIRVTVIRETRAVEIAK
jgi:hypothetical protein